MYLHTQGSYRVDRVSCQHRTEPIQGTTDRAGTDKELPCEGFFPSCMQHGRGCRFVP